MLTLEKLRAFGANVEEGMNRCMNNEAFYLKLVGMVLPDEKLNDLEVALQQQNLDRAFEIAHSLKGMYGNLALTPICKPVIEMTELLRNRTQTDYSALLHEAQAQKQKLNALAQD